MRRANRKERPNEMTTLSKVGAALLVALLLCLTPASALAAMSPLPDSHITIAPVSHHSPSGAGALKFVIGALSLALAVGATVTLTYNTPAQNAPIALTLGGTVPPSAAQSQYINILSVQASVADGDLSIVLVHNWSLTTAQIAAGFPLVRVDLITAGTAVPTLTGWYTGSAANTFTITKASAAGSGATYLVTLQRPNTMTW